MAEDGAAPACSVVSEVGEGPVWDAARAALLWVDITAGVVHTLDPTTGTVESTHVGVPVGAVAPAADGTWIAGTGTGFARLTPGGAAVESIPGLLLPSQARMNDGKVDPWGRFWCGSMRYDPSPGTAALYELGAGDRIRTVLSGVGLSNGLAWSPDSTRFYYVDSLTQEVASFACRPEGISERTVLVRVPPEIGTPDGLTVDAEGCLWLAVFGGGQIWRLSPAGDLLALVHLPTRQVTSVGFGGPHLGTLYVTSAHHGMTARQRAAEPLAGHLFALTVAVPGLPTRLFGSWRSED